jgi:hydrogenase maturation protease
MSPEKPPLAVIGIGNTIAGDDGAGVEVVHRLKTIFRNDAGVFRHTLDGDHFEISSLLDRAEKFIFVDAFEGEPPGELVYAGKTRRAFAPSFHQTDITSVMNCLEMLGVADPFPSWEVWGVTITPPARLVEGLTPEVETAVEILCEKLRGIIEENSGI